MTKMLLSALTTGIAVRNLNITQACTIHHWAGLLDGRHTAGQLVRRLYDEDSSKELTERIKAADVLIIDEISMFSANMFEKLNVICSVARNSQLIFGGLQLICCGNFRQLPPVPNEVYGEDGNYAFENHLWNQCMSHVVTLRIVKRYSADIADCINHILNGNVQTHHSIFLHHLQRPLLLIAGQTAVHLYSTNEEVKGHNAKELINLSGNAHTFISVDTGEKQSLKHRPLQSKLQLKIGAPVVLVVTINERLVNGMKGEVINMSSNSVTVKFYDCTGCHEINNYEYQQYAPNINKTVARRRQIL